MKRRLLDADPCDRRVPSNLTVLGAAGTKCVRILICYTGGISVGFDIARADSPGSTVERVRMMQTWGQYAQSAIALFVVANPIGVVPIFISLTENQTDQETKRTARVASATAAIVLVTSVFAGRPMLEVFGISLPSFSVGGGILILLMAIAMLQARPSRTRHTPEEEQEAAEKDDIAVVPLAIPLIAGPAAISTVIIYANRATGWGDKLFLVLITIAFAGSTWLALSLAEPIKKLLGKTGINIVTRLLGLVLAAIAVEFITRGLGQLLPGLLGGARAALRT